MLSSVSLAAIAWLGCANPAHAGVVVPAGFNLKSFPIGASVSGIAASSGGAYGNYVYLASSGAIRRLDPNTGLVTVFATGLATGTNGPSGLAFDNGTFGAELYCVQNNGSVARVSAAGVVTAFSVGGALNGSNDLAFAPAGSAFHGDLYVTNDNNQIALVHANGTSLAKYAHPIPLGLCFPRSGSGLGDFLYSTSFTDGRVYKTGFNGVPAPFSAAIGATFNIATPPAGSDFGDALYVTAIAQQSLKRLEGDASVATYATGFSFTGSGFDGDLTFSADGHVLYVANNTELVAISVSAASVPIGGGCGGTSAVPTLATTLPLIGQSLSAQVSGAPGPAAGLLFLSAGTGPALPLGGGCSAYLNLANLIPAGSFPIDAAGNGSKSVSIPYDSTIAAGLVTLQAVGVPGTSSFGVAMTNGVVLTLGF